MAAIPFFFFFSSAHGARHSGRIAAAHDNLVTGASTLRNRIQFSWAPAARRMVRMTRDSQVGYRSDVHCWRESHQKSQSSRMSQMSEAAIVFRGFNRGRLDVRS